MTSGDKFPCKRKFDASNNVNFEGSKTVKQMPFGGASSIDAEWRPGEFLIEKVVKSQANACRIQFQPDALRLTKFAK